VPAPPVPIPPVPVALPVVPPPEPLVEVVDVLVALEEPVVAELELVLVPPAPPADELVFLPGLEASSEQEAFVAMAASTEKPKTHPNEVRFRMVAPSSRARGPGVA
jgi:hypothetical protein